MKRLLRCIIIIALLSILSCLQISADGFLRGDMNDDGVVSSDDAIYLLRYTLSNDDYPISQSGDTNRDKSINSNDAIYLLRYTLSPEGFPIDCETLGHIFVDSSCIYCGEPNEEPLVTRFASDANYNYLGTLSNGVAFQGFYNDLDKSLSAFHSDTSSNLDGVSVGGYTLYLVAQNDFGKWNLDVDEARMVWQAYQDDHPLYYWLLDCAYSSNGGVLYSATYADYSKGADRERYNNEILEKVAQYTEGAENIDNPYDIASYYFDKIFSECDYHYRNTQPTFIEIYPECTIVSPLLSGQAINSGFAKLYQLLLNYSGVENLFVWGSTPTSSGWNYIKLDDGKWYWFDIALADINTVSSIDSRVYFCQPATTLPSDHNAFVGSSLIEAPALSKVTYSSDDVVLINGDFTVDGIRYTRMDGFGNVIAVEYDFDLRHNVDNTVEYNGRNYNVINVVEYNGEYINTLAFENSLCYDYLGTLSKGKALQSLYEEFDIKFTEFHFSNSITATQYIVNNSSFYALPKINFAQYGLDASDAAMVWQFYRCDHPMFYWSYYGWIYSSSEIYPCTVAEYDTPAERKISSAVVYEGILEYLEKGKNETSAYLTALCYYDAIVDSCEYMYDSNGEAESALWAHSIMGAFEHNGFVCEGYAKLLQLLLNCSNVETYCVVGNAGGGHAWNLVKLDDGNWYWVDATWGDTETKNNTVYMNYFCATDSAFSTHTPYGTTSSTMGQVMPSLPARSSSKYSNSSFTVLGDTFETDGKTYRRLQYDEVECIAGLISDETLPDFVEYMGQTYSTVVHDIHNTNWYIRNGAYKAYCSTCQSWVDLATRQEVLNLGFESSVTDELKKYPGFTAVLPSSYKIVTDKDGDKALSCGDSSYYLDVDRETLADLKTFAIEFDLRITQNKNTSSSSDISILSLYTNYQNGAPLSGKIAEKCWLLKYSVTNKRLATVKSSFTSSNSVAVSANETYNVSVIFDTATQSAYVIVNGEAIGMVSGVAFPNLNDTGYDNALSFKLNDGVGCAPVFDNFRIVAIS